MKLILAIAFLMCVLGVKSQFAPPAGQPGSTAIHKDSAVFYGWATHCIIERGKQDLSNDTSSYASVGDSSSAIGPAGTNGIVSLGDSGIAIVTFNYPIYDGPGYDFAIFENSFSDDFLEFAFVEVSSDGINYFRFPAVSNIQDTVQTDPFGLSDATKVNNLAGKYRGGYGTPFDLSDIPATAFFNPMYITHIKIIDVIGSIDPLYAAYDINGHKINDPFPTPFPSSGFDLDAVGIINPLPINLLEEEKLNFNFYPNPANDKLHITFETNKEFRHISICNVVSNTVLYAKATNTAESIDVSGFSNGVYLLKIESSNNTSITKIIIQH